MNMITLALFGPRLAELFPLIDEGRLRINSTDEVSSRPLLASCSRRMPVPSNCSTEQLFVSVDPSECFPSFSSEGFQRNSKLWLKLCKSALQNVTDFVAFQLTLRWAGFWGTRRVSSVCSFLLNLLVFLNWASHFKSIVIRWQSCILLQQGKP